MFHEFQALPCRHCSHFPATRLSDHFNVGLFPRSFGHEPMRRRFMYSNRWHEAVILPVSSEAGLFKTCHTVILPFFSDFRREAMQPCGRVSYIPAVGMRLLFTYRQRSGHRTFRAIVIPSYGQFSAISSEAVIGAFQPSSCYAHFSAFLGMRLCGHTSRIPAI